MNIRHIAILSLAALTLCVACKSDKEKKEGPAYSKYLRPAGVDFKGADTAEVNNLCKTFISSLESRDFASASKMLYKFYGDTLKPLTEKEQQEFVKAYEMRPIYAIQQKGFLLRDSLNNEISYRMQIVKSGDINKDKGVTTLSLNPVIYNGKWHLTLLDVYAKGVKNVYKDR